MAKGDPLRPIPIAGVGRALGIAIVLALPLSGCLGSVTRVLFRGPEGSRFHLEGDLSVWRLRRIPPVDVTFPAEAGLARFHTRYDREGTPLTGSIRVDVSKLAAEHSDRSFLEEVTVAGNGQHFVNVAGYYWVYDVQTSRPEDLLLHSIEIDASDVERLLAGKTITLFGYAGHKLMVKLLLGGLYPMRVSQEPKP